MFSGNGNSFFGSLQRNPLFPAKLMKDGRKTEGVGQTIRFGKGAGQRESFMNPR
jgi:hypothetical protein